MTGRSPSTGLPRHQLVAVDPHRHVLHHASSLRSAPSPTRPADPLHPLRDPARVLMTFLASAHTSWHRAHPARATGGSITIAAGSSSRWQSWRPGPGRGRSRDAGCGGRWRSAGVRRGRSSPGPASPCPLRLQNWGAGFNGLHAGVASRGGRSPPLVERVELPLHQAPDRVESGMGKKSSTGQPRRHRPVPRLGPRGRQEGPEGALGRRSPEQPRAGRSVSGGTDPPSWP
jgi:hypothetical protein